MNKKNSFLTFVLTCAMAVSGLWVAGCGPKGVSDQQLTTDIQAKIYADPTARTANVKVAVSNGAVTLTGDAPTSDVALQVVNIANGTSGVRSVSNQLQVTNAAMPAGSETAPMTNGGQAPPVTASNPPPPVPEVEHSHKASEEKASEAKVAPQPVNVTVPAGTVVNVRTIDSISSKTNTTGQTFRASLSSPIVIGGSTVLPSGSDATILLAEAKGATRLKGNSSLEVRLTQISHNGQAYDVTTNVHDEIGKGRGKQTLVRSGIGAAAGAVIGALAGGGRGAAIGSLAGGGAGAGFQLATHGQQVNIPSESILTFTLTSPFVVTLPPR